MRKRDLTLVVMAAGVGSRYGEAKQVDGVGPNGETLMDYSVFDAARAGFKKAVFVIRREHEELFRREVLPRYRKGIETALAFQERDGAPPERTKPWGTGHAVLSARGEVATPFAVANADDHYGPSSFRILADHLRGGDGVYAMVGFRLGRTLSEHGFVSRGVCECDDGGFLTSIVERVRVEKKEEGLTYRDESGKTHPLTGEEVVSLNLWGLDPSIFGHLATLFARFRGERGNDVKAEFFFPFAIDSLIRSGQARVKVLPTEESWFGLTYREDRETAARKIAEKIEKGIYPRKLW